MQIEYDTKIYQIRLIDQNDSEFLISLRNDPDVYENLGNHVFLNSIIQEDFINSISRSDESKYFIFKNEKNERVGLVRITDIDRVHRSACVGADICKEFRGKSLARAIYKAIFKIVFDIWGLNRAWLLVLEDNKKAYELYKKVGFIEEGRYRKARFKNGKFVDYILMGILRDEYITIVR